MSLLPKSTYSIRLYFYFYKFWKLNMAVPSKWYQFYFHDGKSKYFFMFLLQKPRKLIKLSKRHCLVIWVKLKSKTFQLSSGKKIFFENECFGPLNPLLSKNFNPNLGEYSRVCFEVEGKVICLKRVRTLIENRNLVRKYTNKCSFRKYTFQYQGSLNFAYVSTFCKISAFSAKIVF